MEKSILEKYCFDNEESFKKDTYAKGQNGAMQFAYILNLIDLGIISSIKKINEYGMDY